MTRLPGLGTTKMYRKAAARLLLRSTKCRPFSSPAEAPAPENAFIESWKKVIPNIEPPTTPSSYMNIRPPTPSTIPSKLTLNLALPYSSALSSKEGLMNPLYSQPFAHYNSQPPNPGLQQGQSSQNHKVQYSG